MTSPSSLKSEHHAWALEHQERLLIYCSLNEEKPLECENSRETSG